MGNGNSTLANSSHHPVNQDEMKAFNWDPLVH